ncbi:E3 ubiquitin/ISG15 ligase TRIM25-like [Hyperolius riggenbachi]|uniref:E3 ubiquitin/ISG15 ligase TRIM25-like n=1 Tax=Hyperolius riggenbachi TaxID=752182 RepID=UPI0035A2FC66
MAKLSEYDAWFCRHGCQSYAYNRRYGDGSVIITRSPDDDFGSHVTGMASADLRKELDCSICLTIYTDPVTLRCGHNFCWLCIDQALDTQEGAGVYSCPECRKRFQKRPALQRNITLCNIVESFRSAQPDQEETGVFCTYCIHSPVPAVMSCLMCEASLCDNHLTVHSKSPEHVLCDPTTSMKNRKCFVREKILEYYCLADAACICDHQGHNVETLDKASKKNEEVSRQEEQLSLPLANFIQKLKIKKAELSRKMCHIEELCNMTDPLTVLQESHTGDLCDTEEGDKEDRERHDGRDLDVALISHTLYTGLSDIIAGVTGGCIIQKATDISLDINTVHNNLHISEDMKCLSWSYFSQSHPETPERFQICVQVLSRQSFSSGRHYWEVDVSKSEWWNVGMCYPSIDRRGVQSGTGDNNKSWCLWRYNNQFYGLHDWKEIHLPVNVLSNRVRLDDVIKPGPGVRYHRAELKRGEWRLELQDDRRNQISPVTGIE